MSAITEFNIEIHNTEKIMQLFGSYDVNLRTIESELGDDIIVRENELRILGAEEYVELARIVVEELIKLIEAGNEVTAQAVDYIISTVKEGAEHKRTALNDTVITTARGKAIKCKTIGQKHYIDSIFKNDIVFGVGPAGTGKTYLAMAMAVRAFKNREVSRIILTRPAVEAGEKLGFLPGDLQMKIDPYLRPLYDALYDLMGAETYQKYIDRGVIEIAPLAYMRGRTLDDAFIILDEAQNTLPEQMKMFLTRLGYGSKAVITGDITQTDLPRGKHSGLKEVIDILQDINGIDFVYFSEKDVVRHKLVRDIIKAYEKHDEKMELKRKEREEHVSTN